MRKAVRDTETQMNRIIERHAVNDMKSWIERHTLTAACESQRSSRLKVFEVDEEDFALD